jgi:hypothetical protein
MVGFLGDRLGLFVQVLDVLNIENRLNKCVMETIHGEDRKTLIH